MHAKDVIRDTIGGSEFVANSYLSDLSDADLMIRPVEGMNHIAWQLGHLIVCERGYIESIKPGVSPLLPAGFEDAHTNEHATSNEAQKFRTKDEYLSLWKAQRAATLNVLDSLPDAELDQPSAEQYQQYAPTVGSLLNLVGFHPLMHLGQWVSVRRQLKKPVAI